MPTLDHAGTHLHLLSGPANAVRVARICQHFNIGHNTPAMASDDPTMAGQISESGSAGALPSKPPIPHDLACQECGYNLRGLTGDYCPECGGSLETVRSKLSQIPWVHRREMGWFKAYRKTVWLVMFRPKRFCEEMARPVSYADSQSFRWVTVAQTWLLVVLTVVALELIARPSSFYDGDFTLTFAKSWGIFYPAVWFFLWLAAATGVPSYFFHPKGISIQQQNSAIAMSYYACAPLGSFFVAILLLSIAAGFERSHERLFEAFTAYACLAVLYMLLAWWLTLIHINNRTIPQRPRRWMLVGLMVPASWIMLAVMLGVVPGILIYYVTFIFRSLF